MKHSYTQNAWEGKKYDRNLDIKDISKIAKKELKEKYPLCKFSIRIERYSMGQSLHVHLMEAPFGAIVKKGTFWSGEFEEQPNKGYSQLNQYTFHNPYEKANPIPGWNNGAELTKECWEVMTAAYDLISEYNYDDSDGMTDYFDTNFYLHLNIGKCDEPFKTVQPVRETRLDQADQTEKTDSAVVLGNYKGHPIITLPNGGKGFSFGLNKAKLILQYIEDIKAFVKEE